MLIVRRKRGRQTPPADPGVWQLGGFINVSVCWMCGQYSTRRIPDPLQRAGGLRRYCPACEVAWADPLGSFVLRSLFTRRHAEAIPDACT